MPLSAFGGSAFGTIAFAAANVGTAALTLREAVRAWLVSQRSVSALVGTGVYFAVPSQLAAYPCLVISVNGRQYGHNLYGADGTSNALVEITAFGLRESQCIAIAEAIRDFADGFRGPQSGLSILACFLDDESDPTPTAPPDGSDNWIYQATVDYRIRHRVSAPNLVTQTYA